MEKKPLLLLRNDLKIQLAALHVDPDDTDVNAVSKAEARLAAAALERVAGVIVVVEVVLQRRDVDHPLDGHVDSLREEAVVGHARDDGIKLQADALAHVRQKLQLDQLALGSFSAAFGLAAVASQHFQLVGGSAGSAGAQP